MPWHRRPVSRPWGILHVQSSCELLRHAKISLIEELRNWAWLPLGLGRAFLFGRMSGKVGYFARRCCSTAWSVRDCASFGLPEFVRIATRRPEDNLRLVEAIREVLT